MPPLPIGPPKLNLDDVLVVLPGLIEHEAILAAGIPVQDRLVEHGLGPHRIEDAAQQLEKFCAPLLDDLEGDHISHRHRCGLSPAGHSSHAPDLPAAAPKSMTLRVKKRCRGAPNLTCEVMFLGSVDR